MLPISPWSASERLTPDLLVELEVHPVDDVAAGPAVERDAPVELVHGAAGDRDVVEAVVDDAGLQAGAVDGVAVEVDGDVGGSDHQAVPGQLTRSFVTRIERTTTWPQEMFVATGAAVIRQVCVAVASSPSGLVKRTVKVWSPTARPVYSTARCRARRPPASRRHSRVPPPLVSNSNAARGAHGAGVGSRGDGHAGGGTTTVSMVQAWSAGVRSTFPAPSTARTANVCGPSAAPGRSSRNCRE